MACSPQQLVWSRKYRENNREKCKAASQRSRERNPRAGVDLHLRNTYGVTLEEYEEAVAAQGGLCAICHEPPNGRVKKLVVDHDHHTGKLRALLCDRCNRAIGFFHEDPLVMENAVAYLNKYKQLQG